MKTRLIVILASVLALGQTACQNDPPTGPSQVNVTNVNTNSNIQGGATPSPSPGATCPAVSSVNVLAPSSVAVSTTVFADLDATPKPTRSDECNVASPITWSASPSSICALRGDLGSYNGAKLECKAAGSCTLAVAVRDVTSGLFVTGSANVTCQ